jgi:hypothetical protein
VTRGMIAVFVCFAALQGIFSRRALKPDPSAWCDAQAFDISALAHTCQK